MTNKNFSVVAMETLAARPSRYLSLYTNKHNSEYFYIVLGKMAELGKYAASASREIGNLAAERGLVVMTFGRWPYNLFIVGCSFHDMLRAAITSIGRPAKTYVDQLREDTGLEAEDLSTAMMDRDLRKARVNAVRASSI